MDNTMRMTSKQLDAQLAREKRAKRGTSDLAGMAKRGTSDGFMPSGKTPKMAKPPKKPGMGGSDSFIGNNL